MSLTDLPTWIEETTSPEFIWYVKRLSANDTLANGTHQAGPYIPKNVLFDLFPSLNRPGDLNPEKWFDLRVDSHPDARQVRAIWYNNKLHGKTRNETRLTNFGGIQSALLDPENTGALTVFAFQRSDSGEANLCHVWVGRNLLEEDFIEERTGVIEPGQGKTWAPDAPLLPVPTAATRRPCWLTPDLIPPAWLQKFPSCEEVVLRSVAAQALDALNPDLRLVQRRKCEYDLFLSVEEAVELPRIQQGFTSVEEFAACALSVLQRRKTRAGSSLELHLREIFKEEGLVQGVQFSYKPKSEAKSEPDFLFPSQADYQNPGFPDGALRMLGVKTTCKDRWRQILTEANRVKEKHLLTLQEGVSVHQFDEMTREHVHLVVPESIIPTYPHAVRPYLLTLESFIADVRLLQI
jgi:hypothetical protein